MTLSAGAPKQQWCADNGRQLCDVRQPEGAGICWDVRRPNHGPRHHCLQHPRLSHCIWHQVCLHICTPSSTMFPVIPPFWNYIKFGRLFSVFSKTAIDWWIMIFRGNRSKSARKITSIEQRPNSTNILVTSNDSRIRLYDVDVSISSYFSWCIYLINALTVLYSFQFDLFMS